MPIGPCERLIDDFCAHANLFCTRDHLDDWRYANGDPTGQVVNLAEIPSTRQRRVGGHRHSPKARG